MLINVTLPVYNEEEQIEFSVTKLHKFLTKNVKNFELVIVNNGSTDNTYAIAKRLAKRHQKIKVISMHEKGRGRALKEAWNTSKAEILSFMDVDLSADINYFPKLIRPIKENKADIVFGTRLVKGSKVKRTFIRNILSIGYNLLVRKLFKVNFTDLQCGFKAIRKNTFQKLLPNIKNNKWFFDTELLIFAHREGVNIKEIPIAWTEDKGSKVKIITIITEYLIDIIDLKKRL